MLNTNKAARVWIKMKSEVHYIRGQVDAILLSKEDLETIKGGSMIEIDGIKLMKNKSESLSIG